jgi:membrane protease YdiL (CAAX protease family)
VNAPELPPDRVPPLLLELSSPSPAPGRWRWWFLLLLLGIYPLAVGLLGTARITHAHDPALSRSARGLLLVSALELGTFGSIFGVAWLVSRASVDDLLLRVHRKLRILVVPLGIGYSLGLRAFLAVALGIIGAVLLATRVVSAQELQNFLTANRPDVEALVDVSALRHDPAYFWLTVTLVSFVVAGLREELWRSGFLAGLRRLWPGRFASPKGQMLGVAVAALIFGIGHVSQGALAVGLTGLLGFGLGLIMVWHRSIWPAVIAHGMFDATSFALVPWAMESLKNLSR